MRIHVTCTLTRGGNLYKYESQCHSTQYAIIKTNDGEILMFQLDLFVTTNARFLVL